MSRYASAATRSTAGPGRSRCSARPARRRSWPAPGSRPAQLSEELAAHQRDGYRPVALSSYQDGAALAPRARGRGGGPRRPGRYLAYLSATRLHSGEARLSGVFSDGIGAAVAFDGLDRATLIRRQETRARDGVLTQALAAYVDAGVIRFAGA